METVAYNEYLSRSYLDLEAFIDSVPESPAPTSHSAFIKTTWHCYAIYLFVFCYIEIY